ncbi:hypothetical protein KTC96_25020 (plasmid) [Clostridium estertheticum]|uniref:hypothetical protein n=1 Tax=Clostridium estertheticum TaxID=238834 RepID=UPI001C7DDB16|nr:hypothetical protein [Clostridium estertheticum]MBX4259791.1 hypothetical protein [Clostridium estertheticum]WLC73283.1 hypothetical protein KTC96_25020 [Clostridium estertheticum]
MIKEVTQACITTLINGYENQINKGNVQICKKMALKDVIEDLGNFLDYVADLKEDVQAIEQENTEEYSIYVRRIAELEYENKELVRRNDNQKLSLQARNMSTDKTELQKVKSQLAEANESIEILKDNEKRITETKDQEINKLKCSDAIWSSIFRQQIERIKKLTTSYGNLTNSVK